MACVREIFYKNNQDFIQMKRTVSIITTFYNAEMFVSNSVNSVLQQKITDPELSVDYVLVNDMSSDGSLNMINKMFDNYLKEHDGQFPEYLDINVLSTNKNLGCGGARKFGIDHAKGDYLMFLDADDYYLKNDFVQRAVNDIEENQADVIEYGLVYNFQDGSKKGSSVPSKIDIENTTQALLALFKDNVIKFNVWTKIWRKSLVDQYPYSTRRTFEDVETIPVWISLAKKICIMPSLEINYRANSNSIIRDKIIETRLGTIKAIASHFERFKNDREVLLAMYGRSMIDLTAVLDNHTSDDEGFNEMSKLNTYMLKYLYPAQWEQITFNLPDKEDNVDKKKEE